MSTEQAPMNVEVPPELPAHVFAVILQYLLPPSPPVPPHLLSTKLLQRHYFLSVGEDDGPEGYLLMPKSDPSVAHAIILALEDTATYDVDHAPNDILYSLEEGSLHARVTLLDRLQVVFAYEPSDRQPGQNQLASQNSDDHWKYQDVIWRESDPKSTGFKTVAEALNTLQESSGKPSDEGGDGGVTADQPPTAEEFWDGWDEPSEEGEIITRLGVVIDPEEEERRYYERYADVEAVVDESAEEDDSTPPRPHEGAQGPPQPPLPRSPNISKASKLRNVNIPEGQSTSTSDAAATNIARSAFQLWEATDSTRSRYGSDEERRLAFLSLVAKAIGNA